MDLLYIRCPESVLERAKTDRSLVEMLSGGHGGDECVDLGRAEDELYQALGPPGVDLLIHSDVFQDWAGRALAGDGWLHFAYQGPYGSPRFLLPAQVAEIARELTPLSDDAFRRRCHHPQLETYVLPNFRTFREFYLRAALAGQAVVIFPT